MVFHAQIAEDAGSFDVDGVARAITEKLHRRHPHVFGDLEVASAGEVVANWERIKREDEGRSDPLAGIPSALPALQLAAKLQKKAAGAGISATLPDVGKAQVGVEAALDDVAVGRTPQELQQGVGDLLFSVVTVALALEVEPEAALRSVCRRFRERFS